jgi:hypothetical protein
LTVRVVSKTYTGEYSEVVESYTDYRKRALMTSYSASDDEVKEGIFKAGEIVFMFGMTNEHKILPGNRILFRNMWYQIDSITVLYAATIPYMIEARVKLLQSL